MAGLVAALTVVVALLGLLVVGLLRSHAEILRRLHELGAGVEETDSPTPEQPGFRVRPGTPEPSRLEGFAAVRDVAGKGLADDAVALRVGGVDHHTVLAFLSSSCLTCANFWDDFSRPERLSLPQSTRLVIVAKDAAEESVSTLAKMAPPGLPLVLSSAAWADYEVPGSPYFVLVDGPAGEVRGEGTGMSWEQVSNLLAQATDDLTYAGTQANRRGSKADADAARESRIDRELLSAGLRPGDPSLYPTTTDGEPERDGDVP